MNDIASLLVTALASVGSFVGTEGAKSLIKEVGHDAYAALKNIVWGEQKEITATASSGITATASSNAQSVSRLVEYIERHDRALETTLHCLERLAEQLNTPARRDTDQSILLAIGLTSAANQTAALANTQVQRILKDQTPGTPQTIKSGYALLHLCKGNTNLAEIYARSTLRVNPSDAKAHFILGFLILQTPIRGLSPSSADQSEIFFATAAEAGLAAQCALPRAALRFDHYKYRGRRIPSPSIVELSLIYEKNRTEAINWPYGLLNHRLHTSADFRRVWGD